MVRHAPIHRRSGHSDIAICCGRNVRGSSPSTSVVPLSNQVTTLNHKRFKGFKMFSDGHLESDSPKEGPRTDCPRGVKTRDQPHHHPNDRRCNLATPAATGRTTRAPAYVTQCSSPSFHSARRCDDRATG